MALWEINAGHVQRYSDQRLRSVRVTRKGKKKQVRPRTVLVELSTLSAIFREALKRELVDRNPVSLVKKPSTESEIVRYLSDEEEEALLPSAPSQLRPVIVLAAYTGLRESELRGLKWQDVRLKDRKIVVRQTKSKRDRQVDMCDTVCHLLEKLPRQGESAYVFTNPQTGTKYTRSFNNTVWKNLLNSTVPHHDESSG